MDTVRKYELMNEIATYKAPEGSGPRHLAFHPQFPLLYLFSEHTCHVTVLEDDGFDFIEHGVFDALPEIDAIRSAAAIRISKDGNYLYVSNRGHDSITVFKISQDGLQLEFIQNISSFGEHPRDFALSPDDEYLVCANRDTNNLTLYARNHLDWHADITPIRCLRSRMCLSPFHLIIFNLRHRDHAMSFQHKKKSRGIGVIFNCCLINYKLNRSFVSRSHKNIKLLFFCKFDKSNSITGYTNC
ncbi:beta-propeller fold lactonase family protein [Erysipelothrix piscisicarius]|uniref:beta-propeller fold lactonase family protein n=1 Tax=Erysipelothrix piscisicarius TaxID=2485784 RepID=UPI002F951255